MALKGLGVDALIQPLALKKCRFNSQSFIFVHKVCLLMMFVLGLMLSSVPDETAEKGPPMPTSKAKSFHAIQTYP